MKTISKETVLNVNGQLYLAQPIACGTKELNCEIWRVSALELRAALIDRYNNCLDKLKGAIERNELYAPVNGKTFGELEAINFDGGHYSIRAAEAMREGIEHLDKILEQAKDKERYALDILDFFNIDPLCVLQMAKAYIAYRAAHETLSEEDLSIMLEVVASARVRAMQS